MTNDISGDAEMQGVDEPTTEAVAEAGADTSAEIAQLKDQLLRALAEQENIRSRSRREVDDARKYAAANFAKDLLSPADNLRRALESLGSAPVQDDAVKNVIAGIEATERELLAAFERHGIKRLDPLGQRFDHHLHQAIFEVEDASKPAGTVVQVLQAGFVMHDRLLRAAMVGVSKGGTAAPAAAAHIDTTA